MHQHQTHTDQTCRYKDQGKPSQQKEYFVYDAIDRLTQVQLNDEISQQISYDQSGLGNITRKTGVTTTEDMGYGSIDPPVGPYALTEIPAVDPAFDATEQTVGYTNFDKISLVRMGLLDIAVDYGHDLQRIKQTISYNDQAEETKVFAGGLYEEISSASGKVRKLHYIPSPDGVFAIYVDDLTEGQKMHYILKDHLGSYNVIADEQGYKLEELSFDAWGTRRNSNWTTDNVPTSFIFDRGFTGHEHLDEFGLINMNGRVYDDAVGRFLSPDPFVQMPDNAQNFNRYSYCLNNPLKYVDPDGNIFWLPIAIGALTGGIQGYTVGNAKGYTGIDLFGSVALGAVSGGLSGGLQSLLVSPGGGGSLFNAKPTGIVAGAGLGALEGAITGGISSGISNLANGGGDFWGAFKQGAFYGGIAGAAYGGYSGYKSAQFYGFNRILGGSLDDKLDWKVNQEYQKLIDKFGEGCVSDFAVGSNKNFKKYGLHNTEFYEDGDIIYDIESKRRALGVFIEGGPLMGENGFVQFEDNLIFISRRTARLMWEGSIIGMSTLYHEYQHAADHASGFASSFNSVFVDSYSSMMEYRAYQVSYNMTGLDSHYEKMRSNYSQLPKITMEPIWLDGITIP